MILLLKDDGASDESVQVIDFRPCDHSVDGLSLGVVHQDKVDSAQPRGDFSPDRDQDDGLNDGGNAKAVIALSSLMGISDVSTRVKLNGRSAQAREHAAIRRRRCGPSVAWLNGAQPVAEPGPVTGLSCAGHRLSTMWNRCPLP